jgi:hypothetical protein
MGVNKKPPSKVPGAPKESGNTEGIDLTPRFAATAVAMKWKRTQGFSGWKFGFTKGPM